MIGGPGLICKCGNESSSKPLARSDRGATARLQLALSVIANCCGLLREGHHDKSAASTKQSATRSSATRLSFSCCTDRCALCRVCRSVFQTLGHLFSAPEWLQCTCARQGCSQYHRVRFFLFSLHPVSLHSVSLSHSITTVALYSSSFIPHSFSLNCLSLHQLGVALCSNYRIATYYPLIPTFLSRS